MNSLHGGVSRGDVFIVSGPSGAGKGTLVRALLGRVPRLWLSVSATTRPPRPGEVDGVDYYFLTPEQFDELVAAHGFLEWAEVHTNRYGTLRSKVEEHSSAGEHVILEIDPQGAAQVKAAMPSAVLVFVEPPSFDELRRRLVGRGSETPEQIEQRLRTAVDELKIAGTYDYVVRNDDVVRATTELAHIVESHARTRDNDQKD